MNPRKDLSPRLNELWEQLEGSQGKKYWRTLEELSDSQAFEELVRDEFPEQASEWPDTLSRRKFLTLMGASLALAGVAGCSVRPAPAGLIVPYVKAPEEIVPGKPLFFATAMTLDGCGVGLLVESHMGRPTKIEGNPEHPASLGATDIFHQAAVLTLYDPDRSQAVAKLGQPSTWRDAITEVRAAIGKLRKSGGVGLRILSETVVSPTLAWQMRQFQKDFPQARWHQYEPLARNSAFHASKQAFGKPINIYPDFSKAEVILSLDADFIGGGPGHLRHIADFTSPGSPAKNGLPTRRLARSRTTVSAAKAARMTRLYVIEPGLSLTGAKADNRLALPPSEIEPFARALAAKLGVGSGGSGNEKWINAIAADLEKHKGRSLVLAGDRQPPVVHLLAHALNQHLGNVGQTVFHTDPIEARAVDHLANLRELTEDMEAGRVELLIILGSNPVYTAPADFHFQERMQKVALRVHHGLYQDETARQCHWHLPEAHFLEAWSDTRTFDGTASIVQPLIEPLYQGRSVHEVLAAGTGLETPGYEIVRGYWRQHWNERKNSTGDFDDFWETALHDGVVDGTRLPQIKVALQAGWEKHLAGGAAKQREEGTFELIFEADPTLHDGRFANNGWLQELPKPITRIAWDNAVLVSQNTMKALGLGQGSYAHGGEHGGYHQPVVELHLGEKMIRAPIWVVPGHADGCATVYLGNGREYAGKLGGMPKQTIGFDAYAFRTSANHWFVPGLKIKTTLRRHQLPCVQGHHLMGSRELKENREVIRSATLAQYHEKPKFATEPDRIKEKENTRNARLPLTLYRPDPGNDTPRHRWGMAIDLTACVGCGACVVACQSENNIPVVGREQVIFGREMHWLRVDLYRAGHAEAPAEFYFQPVPCMHCEHAPCEYVCPTEATVHSDEGLNDMIYQRCVGTRFCSNNCPYKVRRFNFMFYGNYNTPSRLLQYNPDVTVRSRGVMEKCTYCVQRIRHAEIDADKENRPIVDGEILTACQAACPSQAIVFGDINDEKSTVRKWKSGPLNYELLGELNTMPRTTYLGALRNPNPELEG